MVRWCSDKGGVVYWWWLWCILSVLHRIIFSIDSVRYISCPILSYRILSYPILSYRILSHPILSYPIQYYTVQYCTTLCNIALRHTTLQSNSYNTVLSVLLCNVPIVAHNSVLLYGGQSTARDALRTGLRVEYRKQWSKPLWRTPTLYRTLQVKN